jgi:hypothetical protein
LTARRLVFEYEQGLVTKRTYTSPDVPLSDIQDVVAEMPRLGISPMNKLAITAKRVAEVLE